MTTTTMESFVQEILDGLWALKVRYESVEEILDGLKTVKKGKVLEIYVENDEDSASLTKQSFLVTDLLKQFPEFMKLTGCNKALVYADGISEPETVDGKAYKEYLAYKQTMLEELREPISTFLAC